MKKINPIVLTHLASSGYITADNVTLEPIPDSWAQELKDCGATRTQIHNCIRISSDSVYLVGRNEKFVDSTHPKYPAVAYTFDIIRYSKFSLILVMPMFPVLCVHVLKEHERHLSLKDQLKLCWESCSDAEPFRDRRSSYTWHHALYPGVMYLVPRKLHVGCGHTGGDSIWGYKEEDSVLAKGNRNSKT